MFQCHFRCNDLNRSSDKIRPKFDSKRREEKKNYDYFTCFTLNLPVFVYVVRCTFVNCINTQIHTLKSIMMKKETLKTSNSINMSDRLFDICKSGWMTKRSQNKKRFTPVNYKLRWFELTKNYLIYFDVESVEVRFICLLIFFFSLVFIIYFILS